MTLPALRPLSVGEILDASFTLYRKHFATLASIVLICSLLPFMLGAYLMANGSSWANLPLVFAYIIAMFVLGSIATGATVFVISESYLGRSITTGEALGRAAPLLGRIVGCSILIGIVIVFGFMLFVVPGFILLCGLLTAIPAVVLEPNLTAPASLSRSWALTRGSKWRMFGLLITSFILIYIPSAAVQVILAWALPSPTGPGAAVFWIGPVLGALVQLFLYPFLNCVLTVAYYDLRVRKEGFDLELLASSLQPA